MKTQATPEQNLTMDNFPLDGFKSILAHAQGVYAEEQARLEGAHPGIWPGHAPARRAVNALESELTRLEKFRAGPEMVTLEVDVMKKALSPLMSLYIILERAGDSGIDIPSDDVAGVLGALLHSAHAHIGHPDVAGELL